MVGLRHEQDCYDDGKRKYRCCVDREREIYMYIYIYVYIYICVHSHSVEGLGYTRPKTRNP